MKWFEISAKLYFDIYDACEDELTLFASCTHLGNCSACDAKILTEWGFKNADYPLIRSVSEPESQLNIPKHISDWVTKYYLAVVENNED